MRETTRGPRLLAAAALAGMVLGAPPAWGQQRTVTLTDGTVVSGTLVGYVAGQYITLRLPTGETRVIMWSQLAHPPRAPSLSDPGATAPSAPSPASPRPVVVVLKDGRVVRGQMTTSMDGDHVTLTTSTGETQTFEWGEIASLVPGDGGATMVPRPAPDGSPSSGESPPESPPSTSAFTPTPPPPTESVADIPPRPLDGRPSWSSVSRLSFGLQTGYGSPLGYLALLAEYFPFGWLGFSAGVGTPLANEPWSARQGLIFEWRHGDSRILVHGIDVGFAESFPNNVIPESETGMATYFQTGYHLTIGLGPVGVRAGVGQVVIVNGGYCTQHPQDCPQLDLGTVGLSATLTLLVNLDLTRAAH
jgi:hypothetical protein